MRREIASHFLLATARVAPTSKIEMLTNGLYAITIQMHDGAEGRASGVIVLRDGRLQGGDSHFYYTGSYEAADDTRWRGELVTHQHTHAPGLNFVFGGRDVGCGFAGVYTADGASVNGTALVGKASVGFKATLQLLERFA